MFSIHQLKLGLYFLSFLFVLQTLCLSEALAVPVRARTPIQVDGEQYASVVFAQLIVDIEDKDESAGLKEKHVEMLNDRLRAAGYRVPHYAKSVFKKQELPDSDFVLAGELTDFDCVERFDVTCGLTIEWELMDAETEAVVYRMTTHHEEMELSGMNKVERGRALLGGGLDSLLARPKFAAALKRGSSDGESASQTRYEASVIKRCARKPIEMPKGSESALRASAVVKVRGGTGSAVVISPDGYLLTAAHVASQDKVEVRLRNGKVFKAEVVRIDQDRDVALLRLIGHGGATECLELSTDSASPGEDIYAIGSPGGEELSFSISRGIVSGKRTFDGVSFLQTDASINPGNSGGPLLGSDGKVRAIASWKIGGEAVEGLGFGVPSSTALDALGIQFGDETETIAPAIDRGVTSENAVVDHSDPRWFYVGEDAPGERPGWVKPVRTWGFVGLSTGATILALSYASADNASASDSRTRDRIRDWRIAGWTSAGLGLGMVLSSFFLAPTKKPPADSLARGPKVSAQVGIASLSLKWVY